jgi:hypothetical protein
LGTEAKKDILGTFNLSSYRSCLKIESIRRFDGNLNLNAKGVRKESIMKMMELTRNRILLIATRRIVLKLFLVAALLGASAAVCLADVFYLGVHPSTGYGIYLHCGTSAGNALSLAPPCPPGESCSHIFCDTPECQTAADKACRDLGYVD